MHKPTLALGLLSAIVAPVLSTLVTVQAQSPYPFPDPKFIPPTPISLPLNPTTDGKTFRPSDRPQNDKPSNRTMGVQFTDNRIPMDSREFPWSATGRLDVVVEGKEIGNCTATLIGRDLILTNSHCLFVPNTNKLIPNPIVFKPALMNGLSLDKATATPLDYGWKTKPQSGADDWAILKLDKPLGDEYGYMGWRSLNFADQRVKQLTKDQIRLVGYAEDFPQQNAGETAGVHAGCSIAGIYEEGLAHDCDMNPGASGGALFAKFNDGNYYIVGVNSAYMTLSMQKTPRSQLRFNFGVQVSRWAAQATALRKQGAASAGK